MAKVFVTQEISRINYASALEYGDVVFLTCDEYKPEPTNGEINKEIKHSIAKHMKDYVPGVDYILTSGSPVSILLTGMIMAATTVAMTGHKILKWNNQSNRYDLCKI